MTNSQRHGTGSRRSHGSSTDELFKHRAICVQKLLRPARCLTAEKLPFHSKNGHTKCKQSNKVDKDLDLGPGSRDLEGEHHL